ncbi:MAG TPA: hypothetical protein VKS19_04285 [Verrucomicrobiae bacterium]|nr:hypothetical protein [Verrucomicrobiae bacterium]
MKIAFRIVMLAALAALSVWLWTIIFPSPEKIIRRQLGEVAKRASFTADEGMLARVAGAQSLASYFSTNVEVRLDVPELAQITTLDRNEIMQYALAAHSNVNSLNVKFLDVNVTLAPNRRSAIADFTVEARVLGEQELLVQEMKFTLQKISGQWLITRVETIRTLSILDFERMRTPFIVGA